MEFPTEKIEALKDILSPLTSPSFSFENENDRLRTRDILFEALRKVQSPWDIVWDHNWVNPATNASVKTLIDMGLFRRWAENGGRSLRTGELVDLLKGGKGGFEVERGLLQRLLQQIAGQHLVLQLEDDLFAPTRWAAALASDPALSQVYGAFYHQLNAPMFLTLPDFLASKGYQNPTDVNDSNWQFCKGTPNNIFQDLSLPTNNKMATSFHSAMQSHSKHNLSSWTSLFPTTTLLPPSNPTLPLIIDIGGSTGHDLLKFLSSHPTSTASLPWPPGSLILQDLPDVIAALPPFSSPAIMAMGHDFFAPQPESCRGAAVYFLHNVLHDWTDEVAVGILRNVADAMGRGSRVLVHESFVGRGKASSRVTVSDLTMMAVLSSRERTVGEWEGLFAGAGLRVVRVWGGGDDVGGGGEGEGEGVIEGVLI